MIATAVSWLARYIGWPGVLLVAFYIHEEGVPGADRIRMPAAVPIIGGLGLADVPVIGDLTVGRVQVFAAQQVALATAASTQKCEAEKTTMVSKASADALAAVLAQERRMRLAAETSADAARARADATALVLAQSEDALKRLQVEAAASGLGTWSPEEIEWLEKH